MMISISHVALAKGLVVGALGLLLSTIGLDPMLGSKRFVGGNVALLDGISFIPVLIGLFGIGEMLYQKMCIRDRLCHGSGIYAQFAVDYLEKKA